MPAMDIELLLGPQCPNAAAARTVLTACLRRLNLDIAVRERVGDYPSPTILVDGVDVMGPQTGVPSGHACRLDLPTLEHVLAALDRGATSSTTVVRVERHREQQLPPRAKNVLGRERAIWRSVFDASEVSGGSSSSSVAI